MDTKQFNRQTLDIYIEEIIQIIKDAGPITEEELPSLKQNILIQLSKAVVSSILKDLDLETQNNFINCIKTANNIDSINNFLIEKMQGKDTQIFNALDQFKADFTASFQTALKK